MEDDFDKLIKVIPEHMQDTIKVVEGFRDKVVSSDINEELMLEFFNYMEEICRRRKLDWRSTYPQLVNILISEGIINE